MILMRMALGLLRQYPKSIEGYLPSQALMSLHVTG